MDIRAILLGLSFAIIWSSAFTSARIIVEAAPPLTALVLRYALSGAVGVAIAFWLGQNWRITRGQWRAVLIFGVCQNAIYLGLNFVAMQWIEASLAAIIASTMPLMVAAANWIVFRERLPIMGVLGLGAGFGGVALIMGDRLTVGADGLGIALCLIGAAALTIATLAVRSASSDGKNLLMIVALQTLVGGLALLPFAVALEPWDVTWSWQLVAAFLYTSFVPGLLATWIWFILVGRIGPTRAATFHFLNPFFGVAIAALLLSERLTLADVIGVVIIAGGILAVQLARQRS
ncbi:EamA family transporter [Roseobacter sp. HKCCD9010]|uniref:DMT family transporter n=1 Tax=unclassified Roseobacter TaxID=196798 RepID=UPI0014919522|nr:MULTISPECIES: DMT family transporter [unclassified Roseobacter]MBF9051033.1 EamA family transporter [Rhodobacterales bacterium HKCCD4356]NNV12802.1 EamA family transporter [Roseobacter sp. HKCCD7357]NNV16747.1 EamA family transporter [Roseobacter sp. HKCCD8768]NNV26621.1 EamA family transporter [Roseobacter sp. HKCCD8192]NNV30467.1 EamA family transporter [Roseobacter sp. HKCCD9061]